ncbi:hypothetical protein F511_44138 [Dorcoceras hygrometricum]|uniref:Uncharacterized protein n=1 Tax=Dorcoceras hygrometricum TaxID=472368 RepID=A0A2Z7A5V9_9LAMI|nr:hypothetical protein F511_44138 [Dorcoceras hygrometricum]
MEKTIDWNSRSYSNLQLLRSSSASRSTNPNWYQLKELSKTNPAPPISLQKTTEIDDNLMEKGSVNSTNRGFLWKGDRKCRVEKMTKCRYSESQHRLIQISSTTQILALRQKSLRSGLNDKSNLAFL